MGGCIRGGLSTLLAAKCHADVVGSLHGCAERGGGEFLGSQWGFDIYEAGFCDDFSQADEVDQEQAELYCNAQQGNAPVRTSMHWHR